MNSKTKSNALLFTPLRLRGLTLKNRVCVSPMGQCSALDGMPQDFHLAHYGSFALGGVGMVMIEATNVEDRGRATPGCTGLWNDTQTNGWKRVTHLIKTLGSVAAIQLAHGGPKASCVPFWEGYQSLADDRGGWPTIGPTALPFGGPVWKVPQEASQHDIKQITLSWIESAKRAVCAGFQVIELHFAHGYLVSSFLSPITNHRSDNYGDCLENRMRFGVEIARGVRDAIPDCIALGVRLSVTDYHKDGWDLKQSIEFAKQLKQIGVDFLDCSSGGVVLNAAEHPLNTNRAQLEASAIIQQTVGLATAAVGQIVDPFVAEDILQSNGASLIMIGRALLNNPHWAYEAAAALNANYDSFKYPKQYEWCIGWTGISNWRTSIYQKSDSKFSESLIESSQEIYSHLLSSDFVQKYLMFGEMSEKNKLIAQKSQKHTIDLMPAFQQLFQTALQLTDFEGEKQFFAMSIQAWDYGFKQYSHNFETTFGKINENLLNEPICEFNEHFIDHLLHVSKSESVLKILTALLAGCVKLVSLHEFLQKQQQFKSNLFAQFLLFRALSPEIGLNFMKDLIDARSGQLSQEEKLQLIDLMRETATHEINFHMNLYSD